MKCILRNKQPGFMGDVKLDGEVFATIHAHTKKDEGIWYRYAMDEDNRLDPVKYTIAKIFSSLIGHDANWTLKDEDGKDLEISFDNIDLLPEDIYNALALAVLEINKVTEDILGNLSEQSS